MLAILKTLRKWGDELQVSDGQLAVSGDGYGAVVPVAGLVGKEPCQVSAKRLATIVGRMSEPTVKRKSKTLLQVVDGSNSVNLRVIPPSVVLPKTPTTGWTAMSDAAVSAMQRLIDATSKDDVQGYGLSGVRMTSTYIASSTGATLSVCWTASKLSDGVTIPTKALKALPAGEIEYSTTKSQMFFKVGDFVFWCPLIATPFPDSAINDLIVKTRKSSILTFEVPDGLIDLLDLASLMEVPPSSPVELTLADGTLSVTAKGTDNFSGGVEVSGLDKTVERRLGLNPALLATQLGLLDPDDPAYIGLGGAHDPIKIWSLGSVPVETITMPLYLPT